MRYSQPTIVMIRASAAIQSGNHKPNIFAADQGLVRIQTPMAYDADE